jgi:threonine/homoserine/homoserine lactone efflux protein
MIPPTILASFLAVSILIAVTPGPSWLVIINSTMEQGRTAGFAAILGNSIGILTHTVSAAAGLSALLYLSPALFATVQWLGALYLIYLGVKTLRSRTMFQSATRGRIRSTGRIAWDGIMVNVLNPKMLVLMFGILPQFINPERGPIQVQILALGALHTCSSITTLSLLTLSAHGVSRFFDEHQHAQTIFRICTAVLLTGFGVQLGLSGI